MRFYAIQNTAPDVDVEKRILRRAVIATRSLASDGYIIDPAGLDLADYLKNPVVEARHGNGVESDATVIGRAIEISAGDAEVVTAIQFADTRLGQQYAYLYGVNPERDVFMRAWSVDVDIIETRPIGLSVARQFAAGADWNEDHAQALARKSGSLKLAEKTRLVAFSAVAVGADRGALTRAWSAGNEAAGTIISRIDLDAASAEISALKISQESANAKIEHLENEILALRRDGAAAAARGDTAELVERVRALARALRPR
jgi:hypothetical protein